MRSRLVFSVVILLLGTHLTHAGVYNSSESYEGAIDSTGELNRDLETFYNAFDTIRKVQNDKLYSPMRQRALLVTHLSDQGKGGQKPFGGKNPFGGRPGNPLGARNPLAEEMRLLDISAYFIRLGQSDKVISLLRRDKLGLNFLLYANLGTALQMRGQYGDAVSMFSLAQPLWKDWSDLSPEHKLLVQQMGWKKKHYEWFRQVEEYHYKLILQRWKQQKAGQKQLTLDNLFGEPGDPIQFVGEDGNYQAGQIKEAEFERLPDEALQIVQQLLLWLPNDDPLYWKLAELLNAQATPLKKPQAKFSKVAEAAQILNIFKDQDKSTPEMRDHLRVLSKWVEENRPKQDLGTDFNLDDNNKDSPPTADFLPAWQTFSIGFGTGVIVALLGYWQIREFVRPKKRRASPPETVSASSPSDGEKSEALPSSDTGIQKPPG